MQDEVDAGLRRAMEQLFEEAMDYEPPTSFGAGSASAFGMGVLIGLAAAGSS
jgi:hypothetical protein